MTVLTSFLKPITQIYLMRHTGRHWICKILTAAIFNSCFYCCSIAQHNGKIPFSEIGSLALDSNTEWLQRTFNNAINNDIQLVGLGEVSHGGYEPLALKAKMVQYLVEEKGYRNILLESPDIATIRPVRQYLLDNNISDLSVADSLAAVNAAGMPNSRDVSGPLFRWLKQYNMAHPLDMVSVTGFDLSTDAAFRNFFLYNYIIPFDPVNAQRLLYHWENSQLNDSLRMATVNTWFYASKSRLLKEMSKEELEELQYHLQNETHAVHHEMLKESFPGQASPYRDSMMAANVLYLTGSRKTIVWAHNTHVSTTAGYMGEYLKARYKSRYFMLLTDFSNEANVYVVTAEKAAPGSRIAREQRFAAAHTTIAYDLAQHYGMASGIFFDHDLPVNSVFDGVNLIDIFGKQLLMPSKQTFDVLVIFNNITPSSKPVNSK